MMSREQKEKIKKDLGKDAVEKDAVPEVNSAKKASSKKARVKKIKKEDDALLSDQLDDLRSELKSVLPEPEEFLSFEEADSSDNAEETEEDSKESQGRFPNSPKWLVRFGIVSTIVSVLVVASLFLFFLVEVPDLVGRPAVEAGEELSTLGLNFEIFEEETPGTPPGRVISVTPAAGEQALRGTTVVLRVAAESDQVAVPDLYGMDFDEAISTLTALRLTAEKVQTFDSTVVSGNIVGFLPAMGTHVDAGSAVTVLVSAGLVEELVEVPNVIGLSEEVASQALADAGFNPVFYQAQTAFGELDEAVAQTPGGRNAVSPGSTVLVLVSTGMSATDLPVPDITNQSAEAATTALSEAGFLPERFNVVDGSVPAGTVISQMPPTTDTLLRGGERVGFLVSAGDMAGAEVPSVLALDADSAVAAVREAGFNPILVVAGELDVDAAGSGSGIITQQFPAGGSQYHAGLPVLIYLSSQVE